MPDAAYIVLALKLEGDDKPLDPEAFSFRWRGSVDDRGKCKELKPSAIEKVMVDLKKKGGVRVKQMTIDFSLLF